MAKYLDLTGLKYFITKADRKKGHIQDRGWNVYWSYKCIKPEFR